MLKIVLMFAAGILVDSYVPFPIKVWLFAWVFAAIGFVKIKPKRDYFLIALIFVSGSSFHAIQTRSTHPDDLRNFDTGQGKHVTLEGLLLETPRYKKQLKNGVIVESCQARVRASWISHQTERFPAHGEVLIRTKGSLSKSFHKGLHIEITGILTNPPEAFAKGLFSYKNYLANQGIYRILTAESPKAWAIDTKIAQQKGRPWTDQFRAWAMHTMTRGLPEIDETTRLQWAMVLGWKTWLYDEVSEPFRWSGSMHLFAISGLHVALVSGLLLGALRIFQLPIWISGLIGIPFMWGYVAISGWQTSAVRACIMMSILIVGWMFRRPNSMLNSLFSAAWIILIWQPGQLFQTGFQLSFGVALSLITLADPIRQKLQENTMPDPWIINDQLSFSQRIQSWTMRKLAVPTAVSLAAWIGSLPIIWQHFHLTAPIGLIGNLILIPMAGFIISCAMGSLVCAAWAPGLTELFNHSGWFWMKSMTFLSEYMASLNGSHFFVAALPTPFLWVYFITLILIALITVGTPWKVKTVIGCCGILFCLFSTHLYYLHSRQSITFIPVQNGDSIWIDQRGLKNDFLIDGGNSFAMKSKTIPFLESRGVDKVSSVWISHGDADHIGGLLEGIQRFSPAKIAAPYTHYRSPYFKEIIKWAHAKGVEITKPNNPIVQSNLKILHPLDNQTFQTADDASLVMTLSMGGSKILLLGDLSREGMVQLGNTYPELKTDVLILNRPKNGSEPNIFWMNQLQPKLILVTGIEQGREDRWLNQLQPEAFSNEPVIWDTGEKGVIELVADEDTLLVQPYKGAPLTLSSNGLQKNTSIAQIKERWALQL